MDNRYKKRGLSFNSALDSRVLRAVHNQKRQRDRRDDVVNSRRQMKAMQDSPQVNDVPKMCGGVDKQAAQHQKGLQRYQNLLKWKEMKRKQLEKEKRKRIPTFKTGIYHPSPPRFLVSSDQKEHDKTPLTSMKKKTTLAASAVKVPVFHLGGTPATSLLRVPQFHTGGTPCVSTKKQVLDGKRCEWQGNEGTSRRTRGARKKGMRTRGRGGAARGRTTHLSKGDEQEDLGVKRLSLTPHVTSSQKVEKPILPLHTLPLSFAPGNFTFKFTAPETESTEYCSSALQENSDVGVSETITSKIQPALQNSLLQDSMDGCISDKNENDLQLAEQRRSPCQEDSTVGVSKTIENEMQLGEARNSPCQEDSNTGTSKTRREGVQQGLYINETISHKLFEDAVPFNNTDAESHSKLLGNEKEMDEDASTSEHTENIERNQMVAEDERLTSIDKNTSTLEHSKLKRNRVTTAAKHLTRRSASCCFDGSVTPTLSRLRPRTPCSRSTRRSISAHCDSPQDLHTPKRRSSNRKPPRHSVNRAAKLKDLHMAHDASLNGEMTKARSHGHDIGPGIVDAAEISPTQLYHQKTPIDSTSELSGRKESRSPLMTPENVFRREQGMWTVETSPWINSQRRKKKNRTASDLCGMFDDIPTDGSPIPHHLIPSFLESTGTGTGLGEDNVCPNLLPLLQPSSSQTADTPEMNVWGEESPARNAVGTTAKASRPRQSTEEARPLDLIAGISADMQQTEDTRRKRKSRKSVMFAIEEQENLKIETYKIPGTPVRRSSRMSMGLFSKVDPNVDEPVTQDQDLIVFDSPRSEKKTSCTTRRKSCRVSLLPGMTLSPTKENAAPIPTDLMTWDTPTELKKASRSSVSSLVTPVRRSRRLSKAV